MFRLEIEHVERQLAETSMAGSPQIVARFGRLISEKLRDSEDRTTLQAYVRLLVDSVEVGKEQIRIMGSNRKLAKLAYRHPAAAGAQH